mmetsp:Transcript_2621/g.6058  ORF Transcript_2621/g.6058 Transcript_2621/m.6058 type:complete len:229 (+) Transcript_2621:810-1496(+)
MQAVHAIHRAVVQQRLEHRAVRGAVDRGGVHWLSLRPRMMASKVSVNTSWRVEIGGRVHSTTLVLRAHLRCLQRLRCLQSLFGSLVRFLGLRALEVELAPIHLEGAGSQSGADRCIGQKRYKAKSFWLAGVVLLRHVHVCDSSKLLEVRAKRVLVKELRQSADEEALVRRMRHSLRRRVARAERRRLAGLCALDLELGTVDRVHGGGKGCVHGSPGNEGDEAEPFWFA